MTSPHTFKIIRSSRSYEFAQDENRLTMLTTQLIQERLVEEFRFQSAQVGSPSPTFGPVPATFPPGMVFDLGYHHDDDGHVVPIRFIHFELRRVVIDTAGSSTQIDGIWNKIRSVIDELLFADGTSALGDYVDIRDYSEITFKCHLTVDDLLPEPWASTVPMIAELSDPSGIIVPSLWFRPIPGDEEFPGISSSDLRQFQFSVRAGTKPSDGIYFSAAPLSTTLHQKYLQALVKGLETHP